MATTCAQRLRKSNVTSDVSSNTVSYCTAGVGVTIFMWCGHRYFVVLCGCQDIHIAYEWCRY